MDVYRLSAGIFVQYKWLTVCLRKQKLSHLIATECHLLIDHHASTENYNLQSMVLDRPQLHVCYFQVQLYDSTEKLVSRVLIRQKKFPAMR